MLAWPGQGAPVVLVATCLFAVSSSPRPSHGGGGLSSTSVNARSTISRQRTIISRWSRRSRKDLMQRCSQGRRIRAACDHSPAPSPRPPFEIPPGGMFFRNARVLYQPLLVRSDAALRVTPIDYISNDTNNNKNNNDDNNNNNNNNNNNSNYYGENNTAAVGGIGDNNPSDDNQSPTTGVFGHFFSRLRLLSLFGWTLGGVFVVEWQDSPIGYYREVAVLSGLIARGFEIGAWASHIVVSSDAAVDTGRRVFGLPAYKGSIDYMATNAPKTSSAEAGDRSREKSRSLGFDEERNRQIETQFSKGGGVFEFLSDNTIRVWGWDNWLLADNKMRQNTTLSGGSSLSASLSSSIQSDDCGPERVDQGSNGGLNLPSFSGLLSMDDSETECEKYTPLLRYPLRLMRPRRVRLRPGFSIFVPQHQPEMGKQLKREMTNSAEQISLSDDVRDVLEGEREILFGAPAEAAITALLPCIQFDGVDVIAGVPDVL